MFAIFVYSHIIRIFQVSFLHLRDDVAPAGADRRGEAAQWLIGALTITVTFGNCGRTAEDSKRRWLNAAAAYQPGRFSQISPRRVVATSALCRGPGWRAHEPIIRVKTHISYSLFLLEMQPIPRPRKAPRQARSQAMVEAILASAARVLIERGFAKTTTNQVAECAGVSIGSLYQYFPNKESLIVALHSRHTEQIYRAFDEVLRSDRSGSLSGAIRALVRAGLAAHQVEPQLHRILEKEFPFFDDGEGEAVGRIHACVRQMLEAHQGEVARQNRDLATWMVMQMLESLVHAAAIDPPHSFAAIDVEGAIADAIELYLTARR